MNNDEQRREKPLARAFSSYLVPTTGLQRRTRLKGVDAKVQPLTAVQPASIRHQNACWVLVEVAVECRLSPPINITPFIFFKPLARRVP